MKKFEYKLSLPIKIILIVGLILSVVCLVWNAIRLTQPHDKLSSMLIAMAISLVFIVVAVGAFINSSYNFDNTLLVVKWGIIRTTFRYGEITKAVKFTQSNKLVIYFKDESWFNIVISPKEFDEFFAELKNKNKKVVYEENSSSKNA